MTILQRDVRDLANIEGLTDLPRLLSLLAGGCAGQDRRHRGEGERHSRLPGS